MQHSYETMTLALRVLGDLTDKRTPDPGDVAQLYSLAGPKGFGLETDELACKVIRDAVDRRNQVRAQIAGSSANS